MSGIKLELARTAGRSETLDTWLDRFGEDLVNGLMLDSTELEHGPCSELYSYLDTIELDLQFLRLSTAYTRSLRRAVKYRCQLANESESFYRCVSAQDQWLRTVIQPHKQKPDVIEIHSNVVPRQAWLTGTDSTCPGHELCTRGFFPTSALNRREPESPPPHQCCRNCTLATHLRSGSARTDAAVVRFWEFLKETGFELVDGHARIGEGSSEGEIEKILWRKGIFVRKRFHCGVLEHNLCFSREILVAMSVSHPNIVHYFGYSIWPDNADYCDLFMELMEGDLEKLLTELARTGDRLSSRDSLGALLQVAEAMRHVHERNFVHGDLKPGNILVSRLQLDVPHFYLVKVADFGCTQPVDPHSPFDFRIGTLHYTAPEVLRCRRHGGVSLAHPLKIDVYSFGVVAYQVIAGVPSVYPKDLRPSTIRNRVIEGSLRPDHNLCSSTLDDDCSSLIPFLQSCWDADPDERPTFPEICARLSLSIENVHRKGAKRRYNSLSEVHLEQPLKALYFSNNESRCTG